MVRFLLFMCLLSACVSGYSEGAEAPLSELEQISREFHRNSENSQRQLQSLIEQLEKATLNYRIASTEVEQLKTSQREMNICLTATNEQLNEYCQRIAVQEAQIRVQKKWLMILILSFLTLSGTALMIIYLEKTRKTDFL